MSEDLNVEELKEEATSLGLSFSAKIGAAKLKEKIDAHYESLETSGPAIEEAVKEKEKETIKEKVAPVNGNRLDPKHVKRLAREKAAKVMRIVTIVDNDQRVNNQTNTCTVNCSNEYFDLGTKVLPLNEKIEVSQGHINVLKSVQIPLHVKDNKTGLSSVRMRSRYSVSYEDKE